MATNQASARERCGNRGLAALVAMFVTAVAGCCGTHLTGLPKYPFDSASESLRHDLTSIREAIDRSKPEQGEGELYAALFMPVLSLTHPRETDLDRWLTLGASGVEAHPLFLYPRLTCPNLATPCQDNRYRVPVVLHRDAFPSDVNLQSLSFQLEAWLDGKVLVRLCDDQVVVPEPVSWTSQSDETLSFPDLHKDGLPLVLEVNKCVLEVNKCDLEVNKCDVATTKTFCALRVLPRIQMDAVDPVFWEARKCLGDGDWMGAADKLESQRDSCCHPVTKRFSRELVAAIQATNIPAYEEMLADVVESARKLGNKGTLAELDDLATQMRVFATRPFAVAPVWFGETDAACRITFIAGADLQLSSDKAGSDRFFALLEASPEKSNDPIVANLGGKAASRLLASTSRQEAKELVESVPAEDWKRIERAEFVVLVGDCVDGEAGQNPLSYSLNAATGLPGCRSPYVEGDEMLNFRNLVRRCPKPVFAVPGNHDASVGYPGLTNLPLDIISGVTGVCCKPGARFFRSVNNFVPPLIRWTPFGIPWKRYDGLTEWQYLLGPTNFTFLHRGTQFLCLNSYHLDDWHRAAIGGLALNSGGGVQKADALWFRLMLDAVRSNQFDAASPSQIVFMHHDPRAAQPDQKDPTGEQNTGIYETIETPIHMLTQGYCGLFSYGTTTAIFLPLISPLMEFIYRSTIGVRRGLTREWSRYCYWDSTAYGAAFLIDVINNHLAGSNHPNSGILAIFFAHNNVPLTSRWLRDERTRKLFREEAGGNQREPAIFKGIRWFWHMIATIDDVDPPSWTESVTVPLGHNTEVIRLDDVSDTSFDSRHGFAIFEVSTNDPNCGRKRQIRTYRVSLPPTCK